ncbi:dual specificity protein phosphatase [Halostagnicola sp. A-GB9-2]|uniref:dual specificity protein phosphatase family protein n=1 Tax=Halostagnicola sp. A-GB9-2 TaxID=3048066 RepID=UPI0024C07022|nr:dual specificity protein phosphatase [Halostagnicola sp. A-GB9-2]MDJ1434610.1 dual specificity protein phosphatase [Halostagnicola sp. A-GB9-2]
MNEITDQLWISDINSVMESDTSRFDHVVTVCQDSVEDNIGCEYDHFNIADGPLSQDHYGGDLSHSSFEDAAETLHEALENDKTVLVHCHAGQSRSAAVAAAALGRRQDCRFSEALAQIEDVRPIINPPRPTANTRSGTSTVITSSAPIAQTGFLHFETVIKIARKAVPRSTTTNSELITGYCAFENPVVCIPLREFRISRVRIMDF